jgi:hypothetical protein
MVAVGQSKKESIEAFEQWRTSSNDERLRLDPERLNIGKRRRKSRQQQTEQL